MSWLPVPVRSSSDPNTLASDVNQLQENIDDTRSAINLTPDYVKASGAPTSIGNGNPIIYPVEDVDLNGNYDETTGYFVPSVSGRYLFSGYFGASDLTETEIWDWTGGAYVSMVTRFSSPIGAGTCIGNCIADLTAGNTYVIGNVGFGAGSFGGGELSITFINK